MNDWHGYVIQDGDEALHIGTLPNRKKPCLYFSVSKSNKTEQITHLRLVRGTNTRPDYGKDKGIAGRSYRGICNVAYCGNGNGVVKGGANNEEKENQDVDI